MQGHHGSDSEAPGGAHHAAGCSPSPKPARVRAPWQKGAILAEIGLADAEIEALVERGVIGSPGR
jgi:hypothetical protein